MQNRFLVQIVTSLIFFWALFQFLGNMSLIPLLVMAASGYIWYSNDYKFEVPRRKVAELMQNKNKSGDRDRPLY